VKPEVKKKNDEYIDDMLAKMPVREDADDLASESLELSKKT